jgi:hypothetical protein
MEHSFAVSFYVTCVAMEGKKSEDHVITIRPYGLRNTSLNYGVAPWNLPAQSLLPRSTFNFYFGNERTLAAALT